MLSGTLHAGLQVLDSGRVPRYGGGWLSPWDLWKEQPKAHSDGALNWPSVDLQWASWVWILESVYGVFICVCGGGWVDE